MDEYGIIGFPLSHSFSKPYFNEKFLKEGIQAVYNTFPLTTITELPGVLKQYPCLKGLNVTIPYKKAVLPYLHAMTSAVQEMGACNCIKIDNGLLFGHNTDVIGFEESFIAKLNPAIHKRALVFGTGGAAQAVLFVLKKLNIPYLSVSRNPNGINQIKYADIDENIMNSHTILINSTPVGMYPKIEDSPPIPYQYISTQHYCYDLIYNPEQSLFLKNAKKNGATTENGLAMLYIQAEKGWKIWKERE
ncbi:MAG: shikimate dehydrogenase [Phycisphaerales bacterium]|nr:shikimate dehydrogenase [Phycisphaerales bacterium]